MSTVVVNVTFQKIVHRVYSIFNHFLRRYNEENSFMGVQSVFMGTLSMQSGQASERMNAIGMKFVTIKAGCFEMGRDAHFEEGDDNELPRHRVCITKPFEMGETEVTQAQWVAVMGSNPSYFKGRDNPVERVSWDDVQKFIRRVNEKEGGHRYRLPTEAEWEYAARAGTSTAYSFGDDAGVLGQYAWFKGNSGSKTHPVAQKKPNPWGLYDMHGNVWEWVEDWYDKSYYSNSSTNDPQGPHTGRNRVDRGGSWDDDACALRSSSRYYYSPGLRYDDIGFRLVRKPE